MGRHFAWDVCRAAAGWVALRRSEDNRPEAEPTPALRATPPERGVGAGITKRKSGPYNPRLSGLRGKRSGCSNSSGAVSRTS